MTYDHELAAAIQERVAPDGVWALRDTAQRLLADALKRLPKKDVSEDERRYPTSPEGLRAFVEALFARHYFQVQDSLIQYFASPAFESVAHRGFMHVADIGSGPAVASLAVVGLASTALEAMVTTGLIRGKGSITVHCVINDTSEVCLNEGLALLKKSDGLRAERVSIRRILPLSTSFPGSLTQLSRIARMTVPYDICCMGYLLVPLSELVGIDGAVASIRALSQTGNPDGQLLVTQDKFHQDLHRRICCSAGLPAEMAELKQRVYDSDNQNSEQTYTYCRSCSTLSELAPAKVAAGIV